MKKLPVSPPETKVVAGVSTTGILAIVVQVIQYFWPHVNLPPQSLMLTVAAALGGVVSYYAPHTPVIGEIESIVTTVLGELDHHNPTPPQPAPVPVQPAQATGGNITGGSAMFVGEQGPIEEWGKS